MCYGRLSNWMVLTAEEVELCWNLKKVVVSMIYSHEIVDKLVGFVFGSVLAEFLIINLLHLFVDDKLEFVIVFQMI